jgi:hypothetical protein
LLQVPRDQRRRMGDLSKRFSEEDLSRFFNIMLRAESEMRYALVPRFHLELALMKLVHARRLASIESLLGGMVGSAPPAKSPGTPRPAAVAPLRSIPEPPRQERRESFERPRAEEPSPASPRAKRVPSAPVESAAPAETSGTAGEDPRLANIKTMVYGQSNFLGSCLEHLAGWRFQDGTVEFQYDQKDSFFADLLKSREQMEILRTVCTQVLGLPVKICVRLEQQEVSARPERPSARERAERDQGVEAFRKKFDGTVVDVKDLSRE